MQGAPTDNQVLSKSRPPKDAEARGRKLELLLKRYSSPVTERPDIARVLETLVKSLCCTMPPLPSQTNAIHN